MTLNNRIDSLIALGTYLKETNSQETEAIIQKASLEIAWFTPQNIRLSLHAIAQYFLSSEAILSLVHRYHLDDNTSTKNVGLVLAGNIPLVGFHDVICCYLVGHKTKIKLSDKDKVLLPYLVSIMTDANPETAEYFEFVDKLSGFDAVIATGSDNTAKVFEDYFKAYPHIIRKNRNAVAVLSGEENDITLRLLADDIFAYFGLGCRNVSKLYIPENYPIENLFPALDAYKDIVFHNKYKNNYDYNVALYLLNKEPFLQNEFVVLRASEDIPSRIGTLHYEYYQNHDKLAEKLTSELDKIQCIVSNKPIKSFETVPFGQAQHPHIDTYADGIDTVQFLLSI